METEKENKVVRLIAKVITNQTGIELTTSELWKLRIYYQNVRSEELGGEDARMASYEGETGIRFLIDLFGIDTFECRKMKLLGTEEFKEYCRNHVQEGRDKRDLI